MCEAASKAKPVSPEQVRAEEPFSPFPEVFGSFVRLRFPRVGVFSSVCPFFPVSLAGAALDFFFFLSLGKEERGVLAGFGVMSPTLLRAAASDFFDSFRGKPTFSFGRVDSKYLMHFVV